MGGTWDIFQTIFILFYEINKYGMAVYWVFYLRWLYTGELLLFAHMMGVISFLYLISQFVWFLSRSAT
ncbi:MAG: hypothetical protein OXR66_03555 [Candidatus Woesearchaeota archaeon]|nr:hypothetical protein [Candidatus Woesearchaeota archaeon]